MNYSPTSKAASTRGLTFVEMIIVIAVIGIMSALAISNFSNASSDAREIVARQQQAAVQSAVNAWVSSQITGTSTVSEVRGDYNDIATSKLRLAEVSDYLDEASYDHFVEQNAISPSNEVISSATRKLGWHISLPDWTDGSYPKVELVKSAGDDDDE